MNKVTMAGILMAVTVMATGCKKTDNADTMGPAQEAGAAIDNAGAKVAEETREGVQAADAAAERAGERVEAAAERADENLERAGAEVRQETREAAQEAKQAADNVNDNAGRALERAGEKMQDGK